MCFSLTPPAGNNDTIYHFEDNFNDGDFTSNPAWEINAVRMCAPNSPAIDVNDGVLCISQENARTCGNWAQIIKKLDIPISENTKIQFDVRPAYSTVDEGSGYKNEEFPIMIRLRMLNQVDEYLSIWFCYNYRGGKSYFYKDNVKLVFPNCAKDKWIRNEVFRIRNFFPDAKIITELQVASAGWDYMGYADNIRIFEDSDPLNRIFAPESQPENTIRNNSKHQKAIDDYQENLRLATLGNDKRAQAIWLNLIGETYFRQNMLDSAASYLNRCIKTEVSEKSPDPKELSYTLKSLKTLSVIFTFRNQYDSTLAALNKLHAIYKGFEDTSNTAQVLNEKAELYHLMGDKELAVSNLNEIIDLDISTGQKAITAKAYQKLGDIYVGDSLYQHALQYYYKALEIYNKSGDLNSTAVVFFDISNINLILRNYDMAIEDLNSCLEIARMRNLESLLSDVYLKFSEVYDQKGQTEIALSYYKRYSNARDILFNKEKNTELAEQYVRYETERKNREIDLLKQENQIKELSIRQKSIINAVSFSLAGVVLILVFVIYGRYRAKQKANQILVEKNKLITSQKQEIEKKVRENETMLRELHHRVKNNLQTIYSMLVIQDRKLKDPEAKAIIKPNIDRVWAMALIHHKLYRDENLTRINLPQYVDELVANVLRTNPNLESKIKISQNVEIETLEADVAISLGLIINELLCNAIKHAFHNVPNPTFEITITKNSEQEFKLVAKDNGPGIPDKYIKDHSDTFGLELISLLVTQLKGTMEIDNKQRTSFTFVLKHG
jgi:two-component sensor histidine kinase